MDVVNSHLLCARGYPARHFSGALPDFSGNIFIDKATISRPVRVPFSQASEFREAHIGHPSWTPFNMSQALMITHAAWRRDDDLLFYSISWYTRGGEMVDIATSVADWVWQTVPPVQLTQFGALKRRVLKQHKRRARVGEHCGGILARSAAAFGKVSMNKNTFRVELTAVEANKWLGKRSLTDVALDCGHRGKITKLIVDFNTRSMVDSIASPAAAVEITSEAAAAAAETPGPLGRVAAYVLQIEGGD